MSRTSDAFSSHKSILERPRREKPLLRRLKRSENGSAYFPHKQRWHSIAEALGGRWPQTVKLEFIRERLDSCHFTCSEHSVSINYPHFGMALPTRSAKGQGEDSPRLVL